MIFFIIFYIIHLYIKSIFIFFFFFCNLKPSHIKRLEFITQRFIGRYQDSYITNVITIICSYYTLTSPSSKYQWKESFKWLAPNRRMDQIRHDSVKGMDHLTMISFFYMAFQSTDTSHAMLCGSSLISSVWRLRTSCTFISFMPCSSTANLAFLSAQMMVRCSFESPKIILGDSLSTSLSSTIYSLNKQTIWLRRLSEYGHSLVWMQINFGIWFATFGRPYPNPSPSSMSYVMMV